MARYIDADALVERLKFKRDATDISGKKYSGLECAIAQAQKFPTADVAPKSEVAREIFEEIERFILTCIENDEKVFNSGEDEYYDGRFMGFKIVEEHLAELKKKYTEDINHEDKD